MTGDQVQLRTRGTTISGPEATDQSIRLLLETQRGSVPLARETGLDWFAILDAPLSDAAPRLIRQAAEVLRMQLPRIEVTGITTTHDELAGGKVGLLVRWRPAGGAERTVEVAP